MVTTRAQAYHGHEQQRPGQMLRKGGVYTAERRQGQGRPAGGVVGPGIWHDNSRESHFETDTPHHHHPGLGNRSERNQKAQQGSTPDVSTVSFRTISRHLSLACRVSFMYCASTASRSYGTFLGFSLGVEWTYIYTWARHS